MRQVSTLHGCSPVGRLKVLVSGRSAYVSLPYSGGFQPQNQSLSSSNLCLPIIQCQLCQFKAKLFTCILPHSQTMNCFDANLNILLFHLPTRQWVDLKIKICVWCVCVYVCYICVPLCAETRGKLQLQFPRYHNQFGLFYKLKKRKKEMLLGLQKLEQGIPKLLLHKVLYYFTEPRYICQK